jgi:hypothetical protein
MSVATLRRCLSGLTTTSTPLGDVGGAEGERSGTQRDQVVEMSDGGGDDGIAVRRLPDYEY